MSYLLCRHTSMLHLLHSYDGFRRNIFGSKISVLYDPQYTVTTVLYDIQEACLIISCCIYLKLDKSINISSTKSQGTECSSFDYWVPKPNAELYNY